MSLQSMTNINVDFYDKKYILINAKQLDKNSRFLSVACYNHGEPFTLNAAQHSVYIRYKKADEHSVFASCRIDRGRVIVELTEQMLAVDGICSADLIVVEGGSAVVDANTGAITGINGSSILSTMTFHIDVSETAIANSDIESDSQFSALNDTLDRANAHYEEVIKMAESWVVGGTGLRADEIENNARYWSEVAAQNAVGVPSVVTSIKGAKEENYRHGQIIISADNVGAIPIENIATVDQVKEYLEIE